MIFRKPGGRAHEVYIIEALHPKVEISYLKDIMDMITSYDGEGVMYWRPLVHPGPKTAQYPNGKISDVLERKMFQECVKLKDVKYQGDFGDMVNGTIAQDSVFWNALCGACCCERFGATKFNQEEEDKRTEELFCSELVAKLYIEAGFLRKERHADNYLPKDFSSDPNAILKDYYATVHHKGVDGKETPHTYENMTEFRIVRKLADDYSYQTSVSTGKDEELERAMSGDGDEMSQVTMNTGAPLKQRKTFTV